VLADVEAFAEVADGQRALRHLGCPLRLHQGLAGLTSLDLAADNGDAHRLLAGGAFGCGQHAAERCER